MNYIQRLGAALLGVEVKLQSQQTARSVPFATTAQNGTPVFNYEWSAERTTQEGLAKSSWLNVAISTKARAFASVPLIVEVRKGEGWELDPEHPIQVLLDRPNPFMARQDMMERYIQHLELTGNALWHKVRAGPGKGVTVELWPVLPEQMRPIPSRTDYLLGYEYRPTRQDVVRLQPDEVMHWMYQNPADTYWGFAPIRAAALTIDGDIEAVKWNRTVLAKGARPMGVISLDEALDESQWAAANAQINQQVGGVNNARQFLVVGGATNIQSFGFDATDMDWLEGRRFNREEIFAVIGVPPILAVQGEGATYANMGSAERWFWTSVMIPLLLDFTRTMETSLLPEFGAQRTHRIRPDLSGVPALRENEKEKADTALVYFQAGYSPESIAKHLQLPLEAVPNPAPDQAAAEGHAKTAADAVKALSGPARAYVECRIGREVKSLDSPDLLRVAYALSGLDPDAALRLLWP